MSSRHVRQALDKSIAMAEHISGEQDLSVVHVVNQVAELQSRIRLLKTFALCLELVMGREMPAYNFDECSLPAELFTAVFALVTEINVVRSVEGAASIVEPADSGLNVGEDGTAGSTTVLVKVHQYSCVLPCCLGPCPSSTCFWLK